MANHYRRAKLAADAFRGLSRIQSKPDPISRLISTNSSSSAPKQATFFGFSPTNSISHNPVPQNLVHPLFNFAGKRYYHADSRWADWFYERRGTLALVTVVVGVIDVFVGWVFSAVSVVMGGVVFPVVDLVLGVGVGSVAAIVVGVGVYGTRYNRKWAVPYTVPHTKRKLSLVVSTDCEKKLGETDFQKMKDRFKGKFLPANHPESVRVRQISNEIINVLKIELRHEQGNASEGSETVIDKDSGAKNAASHLLDLNWEVLVVDDPTIEATSLPGGRIRVHTGMLKFLKSDAEVAFIIGHEVGHAVARHVADFYSKNDLLLMLLHDLPYPFSPDFGHRLFKTLARPPRSILYRMELEADHIGMLLTASAGYDPRVAPTFYEKLEKLAVESGDDVAWKEYIATYPSPKKRAEMLARAHVMEEALTIYGDVIAGRGVEGCL